MCVLLRAAGDWLLDAKPQSCPDSESICSSSLSSQQLQEPAAALTGAFPPAAQTSSTEERAALPGSAGVVQCSTADLLDQYLAQQGGGASWEGLTAGPQPTGSGDAPALQSCSSLALQQTFESVQPSSASGVPSPCSPSAVSGGAQQCTRPPAAPIAAAATMGCLTPGLHIQSISVEWCPAGSSVSMPQSGTCSSEGATPATPQAANSTTMGLHYPEASSSCVWDLPQYSTGVAPSATPGTSASATDLPALVAAAAESLTALDDILGCLDIIVGAVLLR